MASWCSAVAQMASSLARTSGSTITPGSSLIRLFRTAVKRLFCTGVTG